MGNWCVKTNWAKIKIHSELLNHTRIAGRPCYLYQFHQVTTNYNFFYKFQQVTTSYNFFTFLILLIKYQEQIKIYNIIVVSNHTR